MSRQYKTRCSRENIPIGYEPTRIRIQINPHFSQSEIESSLKRLKQLVQRNKSFDLYLAEYQRGFEVLSNKF